MKPVIRVIERALVDIYRIDSPHRAEDFIHANSTHHSDSFGGSLVLHDESKEKDSLSIGILFSQEVRDTLTHLPALPIEQMTTPQLSAFSVATEEVSHFHCLLFNVERGRGVSQFELELQGEIDKFLVAYFAMGGNEQTFEKLFERLFLKFRWAETLTDEQKQRYQDAHHLARRFVLKHREELQNSSTSELFLKRLRRFYRLSKSDKVSHIAA